MQGPYRFLWANNAFPAGKYFVQARAILGSQAASSDAVEVQLGQGELVVHADPLVNTTGMLFPENVEVLLDASASMNEPLGPAIKLDFGKFALQALQRAIQVSFSLYDYKNTAVVSQPLSREPLVIRSGEYRLEIDTSPPIVQDKMAVPTGSRKTFTVLSQEGKFQLKEE